jgi:hypothetical protein
MKVMPFSLAVGVFVGNFLIVPLFIKERTFTDGFYIGLIAAGLILSFYWAFPNE